MPYRGTRIFLAVVSVLLVIGGLVMVFGSRTLLLRVFLSPPPLEISTLMRFMTKEFGGVMLMLAFLIWLASRDPVRNVAIIDGFIVGFLILAITPLISLATLPLRDMYPSYLIWGRSLIRIIMAGVFYAIRPRDMGNRIGGI